MKRIITSYTNTGEPIIDIKFVCKSWHSGFIISSWSLDGESYTLSVYKPNKKNRKLKCQISKEQATTIIKELDLVNIQDSVFKSASIYIRREDALIEKEKVEKLISQTKKELTTLTTLLESFKGIFISTDN